MELSFVGAKHRDDPTYNPYCMRCPGLHRMTFIEPYLWEHICGSVHDEREAARALGLIPAMVIHYSMFCRSAKGGHGLAMGGHGVNCPDCVRLMARTSDPFSLKGQMPPGVDAPTVMVEVDTSAFESISIHDHRPLATTGVLTIPVTPRLIEALEAAEHSLETGPVYDPDALDRSLAIITALLKDARNA